MSEDGYVIPDIIVISDESPAETTEKWPDDFQPLIQNITDLCGQIESILKKHTHQVLYKNMGFYICMLLQEMRMMSIHDLVEEGYLKLPDDPSKSSLGMALFIN